MTHKWIPHSWISGDKEPRKGQYQVSFERDDFSTETINLTEDNLKFVTEALDSAGIYNYTTHQVIRT
jgi:hypothetical protein